MGIGIVSYGLYLPQGYETAAEAAARSGLTLEEIKKLGITRKCRPADEDQPVIMAAKAARQALARAKEVKPDDVDVVIWTGEEYKDYIAQTPSIRLQEEIGCKKAWAFDLVGQGVTFIQGLKIASNLIRGDDNIHTVLLAGGTRNVDLLDYANLDTRFLLAASASGGAAILKRGHGKNLIVKTDALVDFYMADEVYVPGGGTAMPFSADNLNSKIMYYQVQHPEMMTRYLKDRWTTALCEIARKVLDGGTPDYLALRHLEPADRLTVLKALGTAPEQSESLDMWGHHGTNDVLISLDLGLKNGSIRNGARLVMVSAGIGFSYAATLIQWGKTNA